MSKEKREALENFLARGGAIKKIESPKPKTLSEIKPPPTYKLFCERFLVKGSKTPAGPKD